MATSKTVTKKTRLTRVKREERGPHVHTPLPRRPCPVCGLVSAYYPSTDHQVRHYNPDTQQWCSVVRGHLNTPAMPEEIRQLLQQLPDNVAAGGSAMALPGGSGGPVQGELADWWRQVAENDIGRTVPKAAEYSAYDLELIGRSTVEMFGHGLGGDPWDRDDAGPAIYAEIGCWWYLLGKIGRAVGAIREGRMPSDDTVQDARIYATMIARIRQTGGWPGHE